MSFPTTVVLLRRHFALHSEAITMQTGIVLMLSSFYCHHQNVTTPLSHLSFPFARSLALALPCSFRTPFMSLHSFECYLQGINFDILCQKILLSFIFGIMQKCSQALTLWVFAWVSSAFSCSHSRFLRSIFGMRNDLDNKGIIAFHCAYSSAQRNWMKWDR